MFQFEASRPSQMPTPVAAPGTSPALSHKAFLAWGEHCVECAMPACYETCDVFDPTPSSKCRRFVDGIVRSAGSGGTAGGEIRFRRWGKLETQGNATMLPEATIKRYEKLFENVSAPLARVGRLIHRAGGRQRWMWAEEALQKRLIADHNRQIGKLLPNVFLAEITNPTNEPVVLILTAYIDKRRMAKAVRSDQLPPPVVHRIEAQPGFTRHELAVADMVPIFESGLPFNLSLVPENDHPAHLIFHRLDLGRKDESAANTGAATAAPASTKAAKLVIFDLDNTLWKGVLLEGEVVPLEGLRDIFRALDERGILISVASKNAPEDAMRKLTELGLDEYLLYPQVGWHRKSESVKQIIKKIDIGSDTVIFVDDNPFERAEVADTVEGVEVLPETAIADLLTMPRLKGANTPEARTRRQMYKEAMSRDEVASAYGDDYLKFLADCEIVTTIRADRKEDFDRIGELVQRTNQLNFSGRKYTREETVETLSDPTRERYVIDCRDKFGSYGSVGFVLVARQPEEGGDLMIIQDLMLSCRVQGKFIEQAVLFHLAEIGPRPVKRIRVQFTKTARNQAAQMVLEKLGFDRDETDGTYVRAYDPHELAVDFMTIEG